MRGRLQLASVLPIFIAYPNLLSHDHLHSLGLIAIFISFYLFREFNRVRQAKAEERRERLNERRQELINNVLRANKQKVNSEDDSAAPNLPND
jgi:hypothetical protein